MADLNKVKEILKDGQNMAALIGCKTKEEAMEFLNGKGANVDEKELKGLLLGIRDTLDPKSESMDLDAMDAVAGGGVLDFAIDCYEAIKWVAGVSDTVTLEVAKGLDYVGNLAVDGVKYLIDQF